MKSIIVIEVEHDTPVPNLAGLVAGQAFTISGVCGCRELRSDPRQAVQELRDAGFTFDEIALGMREVAR